MTPTPSEARHVALLEAVNAAINELEYAAYNYDGSRPDDLPAGITESTGVGTSALIAARDLRNATRALRQGGEAVAFRWRVRGYDPWVYLAIGDLNPDYASARYEVEYLYALPSAPAQEGEANGNA